ncbi:MAG: flagellar basal body P-ring protein FlgI [Planctomycetota bacterium]
MPTAPRGPKQGPAPHHPTPLRHAATALVLLCALAFGACSSGNQPREPVRAREAVRTVQRDVPSILRGTIGSQATLNGAQSTIVSGYGLIVGLDGTGGGILDERIAGTMERIMGLNGIGRGNAMPGTGLAGDDDEGLSPRELLRDPNVAVVLVQAAVPPGAPEGYEFDVYVRALNATSLEGGRLWTTELRIGPPTYFGGGQTKRIATARGDVFINPFAEPGSESRGVTETIGRVLAGGIVTEPFKLELLLDNASSARARRIVSTINSRFPEGPGDTGPTARGRNASSIAIRVPAAYRDRPQSFVQILRYLTIDQTFPEEQARRYIRSAQQLPGLADELAWCLVGLGEKAIPFCRQLYDHPELEPKLAGLRAGATLGDPRAAEPLMELSWSAPSLNLRTEAIGLLAGLDAGPRVDQSLRQLAADDTLSVRVAAYDGLSRRAERLMLRRLLSRAGSSVRDTPLAILERQAASYIPPTTGQGISRVTVDDVFQLDRVPYGEPLIYVTQQGQPRIVLFGDDARVRTPALLSAWSGRLLVASDSPGEGLRVFYRSTRDAPPVVLEELDPDLMRLVLLFAHEPTPEDPRPGLAMSYSEVVGAMHAMHLEGGLTASFATETDRLLAALLEAADEQRVEERPEFAEGDDEIGDDLESPLDISNTDFEESLVRAREEADAPRQRPSLVVPIPARPQDEDD